MTGALTSEQAELVYGMLTQRLYLRSDDPERELVKTTRDALYPLTTSYSEAREAAAELGIDFPIASAARATDDDTMPCGCASGSCYCDGDTR